MKTFLKIYLKNSKIIKNNTKKIKIKIKKFILIKKLLQENEIHGILFHVCEKIKFCQ